MIKTLRKLFNGLLRLTCQQPKQPTYRRITIRGLRSLMAVSYLTMAFSDDALLNIVEQSETAD
jgi:hypothetical protein